MKKFLFFFLLLFSAAHVQAQTAPAPATLAFREVEWDFSRIPQGKPVYHTFEVVNTAKEPIRIDNVTVTCGCTTPEWPKEAIAPGATAKIRVGFNAAVDGPFEKFISVQYNGSETKQIKIKGTVWKAPAGAAPANASVQFLKQQFR